MKRRRREDEGRKKSVYLQLKTDVVESFRIERETGEVGEEEEFSSSLGMEDIISI